MVIDRLKKEVGEDIAFHISNETILLSDLIKANKSFSRKKAFEFSKILSSKLSSLEYKHFSLNDIIQPWIYQQQPLPQSIEYFHYYESLIDIATRYSVKEIIVKVNIAPLFLIALQSICEELEINLAAGSNKFPNKLLLFFWFRNFMHLGKFILLSFFSIFFPKSDMPPENGRIFFTFGHYSFEKALNNLINESVARGYKTIKVTASNRYTNIKNDFARKKQDNLYVLGRARFLSIVDTLDLIKRHVYLRKKINLLFNNKLNNSYHPLFIKHFLKLDIILYLNLAVLNIKLAERMLRSLSPKIIIFADDASGWVRSIIKAARAKNIPSLTIQHGVIGDKYCYIPYADLFCLWGKHSLDMISETEEPFTSKLFETGATFINVNNNRKDIERKYISIFLTTLYEYEFQELTAILNNLIILSGQYNQILVIKPHPSEENQKYFKNIIASHSLNGSCKLGNQSVAHVGERSKLSFIVAPTTAMIEAIYSGSPVIAIDGAIFKKRESMHWLNSIPIGKNELDSLNNYFNLPNNRISQLWQQQLSDIEYYIGKPKNNSIDNVMNIIQSYEKNMV